MGIKIGVIGGAGVAATNMLCSMVESTFTKAGAKRDSDHPEMIIWQATAAPSRSLYYEGKGRSFINDYVEIGNKLAGLGASTLCMNCNTAHAAFGEIASRVDARFINLVEEVALKAKEFKSGRKFVLFASEGCIKSGVYQKTFASHAPGTELLIPDAEKQQKITRGICQIKNASRFLPPDHPDSPCRIFGDLVCEMRTIGAIIMGCTDIRVSYEICENDGIDSLQVLSDSIVRVAQ